MEIKNRRDSEDAEGALRVIRQIVINNNGRAESKLGPP
jgi:hypothetical protein